MSYFRAIEKLAPFTHKPTHASLAKAGPVHVARGPQGTRISWPPLHSWADPPHISGNTEKSPLVALDWSAAGEIVKVLGAVATASAAWFAAVIAYRGLEKWRAETAGKGRYDLATTTLTLFYEMAEILRSAREPFVLVHEMTPKEGVPAEIAQDANFAPERRLLEQQQFFAKFRSVKHEFAAVFGKEAAAPFDDLWRVRIEINHAVDFMLRSKEVRSSRDPQDRELWESMYRTAFRHPKTDQDKIEPRIQAQIQAIEATCRPAIGER
jgi:hypothetical protein